MGRVYRAFQRGIDRDVAVKILHRELSTNESLVARFHREAKVASRLAHPHVVQILLVGQLPDGATYIVMEYLAGLSLQSVLAASGGAIPLPRALHVALQMCEAVGEAHAHGIVHRDIKPDNVMLVQLADDADFVKVLDFGIARVNWGELGVETAPGLIFGTPRYISPEGARGERVGPQGDVYSIATTVYQMLAGRAPFEGDSAELLDLQVRGEPPPLRHVAPSAHVPARVAEVIMRNLSKAASDREADARAFGRALRESALMSGLGPQDILARRSFLASGSAAQDSKSETVKWSPPDPVSATSAAAIRTMHVRQGIANEPEPAVRPVVPTVENSSPTELASDVNERRSSVRRVAFLVLATLGIGAILVGLGVSRARQTPDPASVSDSPSPAFEATPPPERLAAEPSWETKARSPSVSAERADSAPQQAGPSSEGGSSAAPVSTTRAVLDVSNLRPGVGQPVDLSCRILVATGPSRPKLDFARFRISGPGLMSGTYLPTSDDGSGVFRSTFTFLQAGRFEVDFMARGPAGAVRTGRPIVVSDLPSAP
jgi:serine/threonine protein kinase